MPSLHRFPLVCAAALLAVACASLEPPSFPPGASMSDVESRLGRPPSVVKAPGGETVWQYPRVRTASAPTWPISAPISGSSGSTRR